MPKYKIAVTKGQKRYTLVLSASDEKAVRERVHKDGYSILSLQEIQDEKVLGNKFIFEAEFKGEIKKGRVVGDDIFKLYSKLRGDLRYNVHFIYPENQENVDDAYKKKLLNQLEEEYDIFVTSKQKNNKDTTKKKTDNNSANQKYGERNIDNFYMKKSLDETYKLIDSVLEKLVNLLQGKEVSTLSDDQKEKLKIVYNSIIKLKKTTNITKLKEVGELALLKIGMIELRELERTKSKELQGILKETNNLLKGIGSSRQFIEKDKDIKYIVNNLLNNIKVFFKEVFAQPDRNKPKKVDKGSHYYIKTELLLKKYKERLSQNTREYLINIHIVLLPFLNPEKNLDLGLKRKVIKQNITLLEAKKKNGIGFSLTTVTRGAEKIMNSIWMLLSRIRYILLIVFYSYAILILVYFNTSYLLPDIHMSYNGIFYTLVMIFFYIIFAIHIKYINLAVNIMFIMLNFAFLYFLIIFGVVNF